jgi:hypothetical protein
VQDYDRVNIWVSGKAKIFFPQCFKLMHNFAVRKNTLLSEAVNYRQRIIFKNFTVKTIRCVLDKTRHIFYVLSNGIYKNLLIPLKIMFLR